MRSGTEERNRATAVAALVALLLAACTTTVSPSASGPGATPGITDSPVTSVAPTDSPTPTASVPIEAPAADRPYSGSDVLGAMQTSRRPGGVPDQLEREPIVSAVAAELWTYDGSPWPEIVAGGSCGPDVCTLEVAGTPPGALGEDLYVLEVDPSVGSVTVLAAELRGLPTQTADALDAYARGAWPDAPLPGPLTSARWLPPPDAGVYVLSYRAGGEEGSPAVDAVVDVRTGEIELREPG